MLAVEQDFDFHFENTYQQQNASRVVFLVAEVASHFLFRNRLSTCIFVADTFTTKCQLSSATATDNITMSQAPLKDDCRTFHTCRTVYLAARLRPSRLALYFPRLAAQYVTT